MKKALLSSVLLLALSFNAKAQEVGVRTGDVGGNNVALDAIIGAGQFSRIHADVSFGDNVGVDALYDFVYRPLGSSSLNWYLGVGPSVVFANDFAFGASGEVGLEYHFKGVPIAIGADYRPTYWFTPSSDFHSGGWGLNLRYCFGKGK